MELLTAAVVLCLCGHAAAESHYVFTAPKELTAGTMERMCLTLMEAPGPGQLRMTIEPKYGTWRRPTTQETITFNRQIDAQPGATIQDCFGVDIPARESHQETMLLRLSVDFEGGTSYNISGTRQVTIRDRGKDAFKGTVFIQTDKTVYKAGQKVLIRLLTVDARLRPVTDPLSLVFVSTPGGTRLAQWSDVTGAAGLSQLEFQLSDDPELGEWDIHVESASREYQKPFKVEEFVLPKFEVGITGPPAIHWDDEKVTLKVCGKYTHGKSVHGTANIVVSTDAGRYRIFGRDHFDHLPQPGDVKEEKHTDGDCAEFTLSADQLDLGKCEARPNKLRVSASLTEDGTEVQLNATSKEFVVHYSKLQLKTEENSQEYVKPGLPFVDKVRVTRMDGSAASGENVKLCFLTYLRKDGSSSSSSIIGPPGPRHREEHDEKVCKTTSSDSSGFAWFGVLLQDRNVSKIEIQASVGQGGGRRRRSFPCNRISAPSSRTLHRGVWFSGSRAFLQISNTMDTSALTCGDVASVTIHATGPGLQRFTLYYQVMARGNIVLSKSEQVSLQPADPATLFPTDTVFGREDDWDQDQLNLGVVRLSLPIEESMTSGFKLLVYTVVEGEVIADSRQFEATHCLENKVQLAWAPNKAAPKDTVSLKLSATPGSVCGIDVVDQSAQLLGTQNKISLKQYLDSLKRLNLKGGSGRGQKDDRKYCTAKHGAPRPTSSPGEPRIRPHLIKKRHSPPYPDYFDYDYQWRTTFLDSLTAFDSRSWVVLSDLAVESRPCYAHRNLRLYAPRPVFHPGHVLGSRGPQRRRRPSPALRGPGPVAFAAPARGPAGPVLAVAAGIGGDTTRIQSPRPPPLPTETRTYFPETWLFDIHHIGPEGYVSLSPKTPDTITKWVAGAVCSSDVTGLGLADPASITTFQPFFVTYTLPYSVKRGEILKLKVSVLNYSGHQLPVRLALLESDKFETLSDAVMTSCVAADTPEVVTFRLRPGHLGQVNISVVAEVDADYPSTCGPSTVLGFSDAVTRPVLVEPEGFEREETRTSFICITPENGALTASEDQRDLRWPLNLPHNLVEGSERAQVTIVGELLGPSLENLEHLVRQPTGCGEQNMILFAPNIYVMKYLTAVGELTEELKDKLTGHMKTGYQRELTYRHGDQSYSAFGKSDRSGSMWLTAFVVKSFGAARNFIDIDQDDLTGSVRWIERHQNSDGCFPVIGKVHHKEMKGGVSSGGEQALTAYVTGALLSSGVELRDDTIESAFRCLTEDGDDDDLYLLTLRAHARAKAGQLSRARETIRELNKRATREGGLLFWPAPGEKANRALIVEMAAYNVLTMQLLDEAAGDEEFFTDSLAAVRWISEQRNGQGGFVSTQDTVLALEALAAFSLRIPRSESTDMKLHVTDSSYGTDQTLHVTAANRLLTQRLQMDALPTEVRVEAEGTGCALVQAILKYNVKDPEPSEAFTLSVTAEAKLGQKKCLKHYIEICTSYTGDDGSSNMAVVELDMVSGFVPSKSSLKALKADTGLDLKRWDVNNNRVAFYFDSLSAEEKCFTLLVQQEQELEDVKPAVAKVYDYYHTEQQVSKDYRLDVDCERMSLPIVPLAEPAVEARRARFEDWWSAEDDLALPEGDGVAPVLLPPPPGFQRPGLHFQEEPDCPVCLESARTADLHHYLCQEGAVYVARLDELGELTYQSRWAVKGKPRRLDLTQQLIVEDGCDCYLDTGRPLYLFGISVEQRRRQQLQLTDQHVLAAAPAAKRLLHRQIQLARKEECEG